MGEYPWYRLLQKSPECEAWCMWHGCHDDIWRINLCRAYTFDFGTNTETLYSLKEISLGYPKTGLLYSLHSTTLFNNVICSLTIPYRSLVNPQSLGTIGSCRDYPPQASMAKGILARFDSMSCIGKCILAGDNTQRQLLWNTSSLSSPRSWWATTRRNYTTSLWLYQQGWGESYKRSFFFIVCFLTIRSI